MDKAFALLKVQDIKSLDKNSLKELYEKAVRDYNALSDVKNAKYLAEYKTEYEYILSNYDFSMNSQMIGKKDKQFKTFKVEILEPISKKDENKGDENEKTISS